MKTHSPLRSTTLGIIVVGLLMAGHGPARSATAEQKYIFEKAISYQPSAVTAASDYARERCVLDFYRPEGVKGFPTVVYYHGGGLRDAPPTLCVTGGWGVDMLMRAEENLYFVSMMKLVGHQNVRQIVIEDANHGRCGRECWPHVTAFIETTLAGMKRP